MTKRKPFKFRSIIRDDESTVECDKTCEECEHYKHCEDIGIEILRYVPDVRSFGAELSHKASIFPLIETSSEERARKLYAVLAELHIATLMNKRWNAHHIAVNLGISVYRVRQRLAYLVEHNFVSNSGSKYTFSFGRSTSAIIKYYCAEFNTRFGHKPITTAVDSGVITPMLSEYADDEIKRLISAYLDLKEEFIIRNGYSLRFFPSRINYLLTTTLKSKPKSATVISQTQLDAYMRGKADGKWNGTEEWTAPYEELLNKNVAIK